MRCDEWQSFLMIVLNCVWVYITISCCQRWYPWWSDCLLPWLVECEILADCYINISPERLFIAFSFLWHQQSNHSQCLFMIINIAIVGIDDICWKENNLGMCDSSTAKLFTHTSTNALAFCCGNLWSWLPSDPPQSCKVYQSLAWHYLIYLTLNFSIHLV